MKKKKTIKTIIEEVIANGIGWVAGLLSIDLLDMFFVKKSIWNLWGGTQFISKRKIVSGETMSFLEWVLTAIIGFIVMVVINKFVKKKLFKKKREESKQEEIQSEEHVISTVYDENVMPIDEEEQITPENVDVDLNTETEIPPKTE